MSTPSVLPRSAWRVLATLAGVAVLAAGCGGKPESAAPAKPNISPSYSATTGLLEKLEYDSNKNGKPDTWAHMAGPRVVRIEIDRDEDGKIDRWEYYRPDRTVEKIGLSRANNGKPDAWAFQGTDGTLERMELATRADGRVNRTEYYTRGVKTRAAEDSNGDGRIDRWETWAADALAEVVFDNNGDGKPDRKITYPGGGSTAAKSDVVR